MKNKKVKLVALVIGIFSIIILSTSCRNPAAKYIALEFHYDDTLLQKTNISEEEYRRYEAPPVEADDLFIQEIGKYGYNLVDTIEDKGHSLSIFDNTGKEVVNLFVPLDYFSTNWYLGSQDRIYLCTNLWEVKGWGGAPLDELHSSGAIMLDDGTIYPFAKGDVPLTIQGEDMYFFRTNAVFKRNMNYLNEDIMVAKMKENKLPKNIKDIDNGEDIGVSHCFFEISATKISLYAYSWVNNAVKNTLLLEAAI